MRPVLLEFAGFGSFREAARVDFADADYFAVVGPTGAGKSTVIDALTFALYGTVARWDDRRTVTFALPPGGARATVRLVFDLGGRRYSVVRELRRAPGGAVGARGARLERWLDPGAAPADGPAAVELLAADSRVTPAVERLLGLPFEHFRVCVVLPQGQFAQFLHARPGDRQRILVKLLGLDVYEAVGRAAGAEATAAGQRAELLGEQVGELADATAEAGRAAGLRLAEVAGLVTTVQAELPRLRAAAETAVRAQDGAARLIAERDALGWLTIPEETAALAARATRAAAQVTPAAAALALAEQADSAAREALATGGDRSTLEKARAGYDELADLAAAIPTARGQVADAAAGLARARSAATRTVRVARDARHRWEAAVRVALAAGLRPHLAVGQPCPVCEQEVGHPPPPLEVPAVAAAEAALEQSEHSADAARQARDEAAGAHRAATAALTALADRNAARRSALAAAGTPPAEVVAGRLAEAGRRALAARTADAALRAARATRDRADRERQRVAGRLGRAWAILDAARDPLVVLGAPPLPRDDLAAAWRRLTDWSGAQAASRERDLVDAGAAARAARAALAGEEDRVIKLLAGAGVELPDDRPVGLAAEPAVVAALGQARAVVDRLAERRALAERLTAARDEAGRDRTVAHGLAGLLRADGFPRWLVGAALDLLVTDASAILAELSGGRFDLAHEAGSFEVIDHHDADARRPVKTLSGGETFQASLALALALSAQLATMAATGAATPESLILDEGFGTLDDVTLETVAGTLENLAAAQGRMVGLVTHHPALAARVPVRYRVSRDHHTSRVAREDPGA